ncbi:unnamed protein product [Pleuronectes platessa]|uniref:Uncharacterized protein n=1 Tax=Pleuronectes platessa TaxID=8262 RepID=A0A9N7ZDP0_PLEPL|nr:unnamed protein product [Pleuronectes platessa]
MARRCWSMKGSPCSYQYNDVDVTVSASPCEMVCCPITGAVVLLIRSTNPRMTHTSRRRESKTERRPPLFLIRCSLSWGGREAGPEVRQMEVGDTPTHTQAQVRSCGNGVMEKAKEKGSRRRKQGSLSEASSQDMPGRNKSDTRRQQPTQDCWHGSQGRGQDSMAHADLGPPPAPLSPQAPTGGTGAPRPSEGWTAI